MAPDARRIQWTAAGLMAGATVMLLVLSFIPWHHWDIEQSDYRGTSGVWTYHERAGDLGHDTGSWFDDWSDDDGLRDGIASLRVGAILLTLAGVGSAVATAFILMDLRWRAGIVAGAAALTMITATALTAYGTMAWANVHVDRFIGYYLAILTCVAGALGAILAFLPTPGLDVKGTLDGWANSD